MIPVTKLAGKDQFYETIIRGYPGWEDDDPDHFEVALRPEIHPIGVTISVTAVYRGTEKLKFREVKGSHLDLPVDMVIKLPDHNTPELRVVFHEDPGYDGPITVVEMGHEEADQKGFPR